MLCLMEQLSKIINSAISLISVAEYCKDVAYPYCKTKHSYVFLSSPFRGAAAALPLLKPVYHLFLKTLPSARHLWWQER